MKTRQTLILGNERFRVGPWHADPHIAYLSLTPDVPRPSVTGLQRCLRRLGGDGYSSIITAALHPQEAAAFLQAGFSEYDRLRVLSHPLRDLDPPRRRPDPRLRLRRARAADRAPALAVDAARSPPSGASTPTGSTKPSAPRRRPDSASRSATAGCWGTP